MDNLQINGFKSTSGDGLLNYHNVPEKRTASLIKRIKRLQWKQLEQHTTEQLEAFYERQTKQITATDSVKSEPLSQFERPISSTRVSNCSLSQPSQQESQEIQTSTQTTQTTPTTPTQQIFLQPPITPTPIQFNLNPKSTTHLSTVQLTSTNNPSPPTPAKLSLSTNLPLASPSKNGENINLIPSEGIKSMDGSFPVVNLADKKQLSGLQSSDVINSTISIGTETSTVFGTTSASKSKLNLPSEITLQSMADSYLPKNSVPDRSLISTTDVNQVVNNCNNFTPSILDCAEDELLRSAVGIITANLKHLEYSYDSDATESSSGGESCDEFENVFSDTFSKSNSSSQILEPIERKANWRWLNERSAIASRWTWLQAQVADLEFKIRQQNEMYRQLRASKGSIAFYCKEAPPISSSSLPNCLSKSSPSLTSTPLPSTVVTTTAPSSSSCSLVPTIATTTSKPSTPSIQIPPTTTTTTTTKTSTSLVCYDSPLGNGSHTKTKIIDNQPAEDSSSNFNSSSPNSSCTRSKINNNMESGNEVENTQTNIGNSFAPNSNGSSDCSLPSVNSDSTISLSPPSETTTGPTTTISPSPSLQPPDPPTSSAFSSTCTLTSSTIATTTTATCTTTASLSLTPQKQSPFSKDSTTPNSDENKDNSLNSIEKEIHHCARTLPLKQMRKRKLVRSCNAIAIASRKIARYSTVQCTCTNYPKFVSPCVLCNGRFSHLQMIDTDCMPNYERYALLDASYHPVLSLPNDVALGLYFSKLLKKDTVQRPLISSSGALVTGSSSTLSALSVAGAKAKTKANNKRSNHAASEFSFKFGPDAKKAQLNRRKSQAVISSTKLKKKYDGTTKKKYAKGNSNLRKRSLREKNDQANGSGDDVRTDSPSPSPLSSENSNVPSHRRRRSEQYAYDINNIVIPYSIASTTRVEKLQYKEIITPKWRYVETTNSENIGISNDSSNQNNNSNSMEGNLFQFNHEAEETDEDTSDETFAIRHLKCEIDERKQFSSFLKNPGGTGPGRGRGARTRLDSTRSEGGKNTLNNNNSGKNNLSKSKSSNISKGSKGSKGIQISNINDSVPNVDLSSRDSIVTAPINLNMSSNDDSLPPLLPSSTSNLPTVTSTMTTTASAATTPTATSTFALELPSTPSCAETMSTTTTSISLSLSPTVTSTVAPSITQITSTNMATSILTSITLTETTTTTTTSTSTSTSTATTTETSSMPVTPTFTSSTGKSAFTVSMTAPPTPTSDVLIESVGDQESVHCPPSKTHNRYRTSSSSKCEDLVDVDETFVEVHPYDKRTFPISEQEYEEMLRVSMESILEEETEIKSEAEDDASKDGSKDREAKRPRSLSQNCNDDSVSIDGDVLSLAKGGKVSRCSSSASSNFVVNGVDSEEEEIEEDATDPEWEPCKPSKEL